MEPQPWMAWQLLGWWKKNPQETCSSSQKEARARYPKGAGVSFVRCYGSGRWWCIWIWWLILCPFFYGEGTQAAGACTGGAECCYPAGRGQSVVTRGRRDGRSLRDSSFPDHVEQETQGTWSGSTSTRGPQGEACPVPAFPRKDARTAFGPAGKIRGGREEPREVHCRGGGDPSGDREGDGREQGRGDAVFGQQGARVGAASRHFECQVSPGGIPCEGLGAFQKRDCHHQEALYSPDHAVADVYEAGTAVEIGARSASAWRWDTRRDCQTFGIPIGVTADGKNPQASTRSRSSIAIPGYFQNGCTELTKTKITLNSSTHRAQQDDPRCSGYRGQSTQSIWGHPNRRWYGLTTSLSRSWRFVWIDLVTTIPAFCWVFHDGGAPFHGGHGAYFSNGDEEVPSPTIYSRIAEDEPEAERSMNSQEDCERVDHPDEDRDGSPDEPDSDGDDVVDIAQYDKWILYRPNIILRQQVHFCPILIDGKNHDSSFITGIRQCWPNIDPNGLQPQQVHESVLRSATRKGADRVLVGDDRADGRYLTGGNLRIVVEVQIFYYGDFYFSDSYARYAPWRADFPTLFHQEPWHRYCYEGESENCFGFVNGAFRPWRSITRFFDADFVAVQVHRREVQVHGSNVLHFQEDDVDVFEGLRSTQPCGSTCSEVDRVGPRSVIFFRPREPVPGRAPYWTADEYDGDGQTQFGILLRPCWDDLIDLSAWSYRRAHVSALASQPLAMWNQVYIINHRVDQRPSHSLVIVLIEIIHENCLVVAPIHVRAEWLPATDTPASIVGRIDRDRECLQSGHSCQLTVNGFPVAGSYPFQLQHGDFMVLHVRSRQTEKEQAVQIWRPHANIFEDRSSQWPMWKILLIDLMAFICTFLAINSQCG